MTALHATATITIDRPAEVVRAQFGDVAHHQRADVHAKTRFELIDDDAHQCRYRQVTSVGPFRLRQHLTLDRSATGPLVNTVTKGPLAGGTIVFRFEPCTEGQCRVVAAVNAELRGPGALIAPLLRRQITRDLSDALIEDKHDLEQGSYPLVQ